MSEIKSSWINLSANLQSGVEVMNKVELKKYQLFLNRIVQEMLTNIDSYKPFTNEEEEKLLISLVLERQELDLLIYTSIVILNQIVYSTPSPENLHKSLTGLLKLTEEKSMAFVNIWKNNSKKLYLKFKQKSIYARKLEDISWLVNIEISTQGELEKFEPKAILQFKLKDNQGSSNLTVEANENKLLDLYKALENIQESLDSLA